MNELALQLSIGVLIGLSAGYIGSFMVLRRMSLVGDALSHVALPGIAIALLFNLNPFLGAFAALLLAIFLIWLLEKKTELPSETLVGIMFTVSLALGLLITPEPELLEALFGDISKVTVTDLWITLAVSLAVVLIIRKIADNLMLGIISKELAMALKIPVNRLNLIFLFLVAFTVALGIKVAGVMLTGSLVIIPAAAAKNISVNLSQYTLWALVLGALSSVIGLLMANYFGISPGPTVILSAGVIFLGTLVFKR